MIERHPSPTSILFLAIILSGLPTGVAVAACEMDEPTDDAVVTCDATAPNPDPRGVQGPDADGVEVSILPAAVIEAVDAPGIALDTGADITVEGTVRGAAAIQFGQFDAGPEAEGVAADRSAIELAATILRALQADRASQLVNDTITSKGAEGLTLQTESIELSESANRVMVRPSGIAAGAAGAAALATPGGSSLGVTIDGGGSIIADGAAAIDVGPAGATLLELVSASPANPALLATVGDRAPAVLARVDRIFADGFEDQGLLRGVPAGDGAALAVQIIDGMLATSGDRAPGVTARIDGSSLLVEAVGGPAEAPVISTAGAGSPGIIAVGPGTGRVVIDLVGEASAPRYETTGPRSGLLDVQLGGESSASVAAARVAIETAGAGSPALAVTLGDRSDFLLLLDGPTLATAGPDSPVVSTGVGATSTSDHVLVGAQLTSQGDRSPALHQRHRSSASSSASTFIADSTLRTIGNASTAFRAEPLDGGATRTVELFRITARTEGTDSPGVDIGGVGLAGGSAMATTAEDLEVTTGKARSPAFIEGESGGSSALSTQLRRIDLSTDGDDSPALVTGSLVGNASVRSLGIVDAELTTGGADSPGLVARGLAANGDDTTASTQVMSLEELSVTTVGPDSTGMSVFDPAAADGVVSFDASSRALAANGLAVSTEGDRSPGLLIYGQGDGVTDSDATANLGGIAVTTEGSDAPGFRFDFFGRDAVESSVTAVLADVEVGTAGDRSPGLVIGREGRAMAGGDCQFTTVAIEQLDIQTTGADSIGLLLNAFNPDLDPARSFRRFAASSVTTATSGARAHALVVAPGMFVPPPTASRGGGCRFLPQVGYEQSAAMFDVRATGHDAHGVVVNGTDSGPTVLAVASGSIHGGRGVGAGVRIEAATSQAVDLDLGADLHARSDRAISGDSGPTKIDLSGMVFGFTEFGSGDDQLNLSGAQALRDFRDTDGDGVRETLNVAAADFGDGTDHYRIETAGMLLLQSVPDLAQASPGTDDDGAPTSFGATGLAPYFPPGSAARPLTVVGVEQARMLRLELFEHHGLISLADAGTGAGAPVAGDVLVITGADAPGTDGGGTYRAEGGSLALDVVLDSGSSDTTDVLVVDNAATGAGGPVQVSVSNAGGAGAATGSGPTDGILLIQVLGTSAPNAFELAAPVTAGGFAYELVRADGQNWYLQATPE